MAKLCSLCSAIPFVNLPPFPTWLRTNHLLLGPTSNVVPFAPEVDALQEEDEETRNDKLARRKIKPDMSLGLAHHRDLNALCASANTCELCKIMCDSVLEVKRLWEEAEETPSFAVYDRSGPPKYELYISARRQPDNEDGFLVWSMSKRNTEVFLVAAVGYCVDDESPLSSRFRGRPITGDLSTQTSFKRYRQWLKQCESDHSLCRELTDTPGATWPLRLLDLTSDQPIPTTIKLVEHPAAGTKYATLSHCWGSSLNFTLTHDTMHLHKEAIKVSDLPQTYQDAVVVACELGVSYIWIDSLCICQDDGKEWERESAKMASIYSNAYICIAASSAASDAAGFLKLQHPRTYVTVPVTLQKKGEEQPIAGDLKVFSIEPHLGANGSHYMFMEHEALPTRAWALQERYLAPRTILFGSSQAFFECGHSFVTEDGWYTPQSWFTLAKKSDNTPQRPKLRPDFTYRRGKRWYTLLGQYSDLKLTKETDKLPALSGLARAFEHVMGGEYVAGLWKADLIEGLAFQCYGQTRALRPEEWRAPTWSWASVDGLTATTEIGDWEDLLEVKDVHVQVKGENPYGELVSAELHLRGLVEKLSVSDELNPYDEKVPIKRNVRLCIKGGSPIGSHVSFDVKDAKEGTHGMELFGIPLAGRFHKERPTVYVLVVVRDSNSGPNVFKREGWMMTGSEDVQQRWKGAKEKNELEDIVLI